MSNEEKIRKHAQEEVKKMNDKDLVSFISKNFTNTVYHIMVEEARNEFKRRKTHDITAITNKQ